MSRLLEATYQNGSLILDVKLPDSMEGKKVKIVLLECDFHHKMTIKDKICLKK
jgi:predicted DNA-binding antitoxin AbrB/MazE fold protein